MSNTRVVERILDEATAVAFVRKMATKKEEVHRLLKDFHDAVGETKIAYNLIIDQKRWELQQMILQFFWSCNEELSITERAIHNAGLI